MAEAGKADVYILKAFPVLAKRHQNSEPLGPAQVIESACRVLMASA